VANPYAGTIHYAALQRQTETQYWMRPTLQRLHVVQRARHTYLIDMQGRVRTLGHGHDAACWTAGTCWTGHEHQRQTGLKEFDWNGNTVWQYYETRAAYHPHGAFQRIYDPKLGAYATIYLANKDVTAADCIAAAATGRRPV